MFIKHFKDYTVLISIRQNVFIARKNLKLLPLTTWHYFSEETYGLCGTKSNYSGENPSIYGIQVVRSSVNWEVAVVIFLCVFVKVFVCETDDICVPQNRLWTSATSIPVFGNKRPTNRARMLAPEGLNGDPGYVMVWLLGSLLGFPGDLWSTC